MLGVKQTDRQSHTDTATQAGRQTHRQTDRLAGRQFHNQPARQADRQAGSDTDRQAGRQTDRQAGSDTTSQPARQTERQTETDTETDRSAYLRSEVLVQFGPVPKSMDDKIAVFLTVMAAALRRYPATVMASRVTCNNHDNTNHGLYLFINTSGFNGPRVTYNNTNHGLCYSNLYLWF